MMSSRVVVVDDHPLVAQGIEAALAGAEDLHVVAMCHTGRDAIRTVGELDPQLVLLDVRLPDQDGLEVARALRQSNPDTRIIMLTAFDDAEILRSCLELGACGVLLKGSLDLNLPAALREVLRGGVVVDDTVAKTLERAGSLLKELPVVPHTSLRPREVEILKLMASGLTTRTVAAELHLSINTVRSYTQSLMEKLGAHTRVQAIVMAKRMQIL